MKSARLLLSSGLCLPLAFLPLAMSAQTPSRFASYEHCRFSGDLALAETTPLAKGIEGRTVKTVMGDRNVPLAGGTRLMYGYPNTDFFANVKVEQIPSGGYPQAKQDLIANFEQILTADDSSTRNYALKPRLNGLEIYGLDRNKLEGGVLGIYLFFVDRTHTATTIYFLNQDPAERKFSDLAGYAALRDSFLETLTGCAAGHPHSATPATGGSEPAEAQNAVPGQGLADAPNTAALPNAPLPSGVPAPTNAAPATSEPVAKKVAPATRKTPPKPAHTTTKKTSTAKAGKKPSSTKASRNNRN